jgi:hypothetical protein
LDKKEGEEEEEKNNGTLMLFSNDYIKTTTDAYSSFLSCCLYLVDRKNVWQVNSLAYSINQ